MKGLIVGIMTAAVYLFIDDVLCKVFSENATKCMIFAIIAELQYKLIDKGVL